jgi:hypothetical protein
VLSADDYLISMCVQVIVKISGLTCSSTKRDLELITGTIVIPAYLWLPAWHLDSVERGDLGR